MTRLFVALSLTALASAALIGTAFAHAPAAPEADSHYAIAVHAAAVTEGAAGHCDIVITPTCDGCKYNKDYPATAVVDTEAPAYVAVPKKKFSQLKDEFTEADDKRGAVRIPFTGKAAGSEKLSVTAKFSVCNATMCYLKTASVSVPVQVTAAE